MSYAGMAASVVGGIMQAVANRLAQDRMGQEFQRGINNQNVYRQQGADIFNQSIEGWSPEATQAQMAAGQAHREGTYSDLAKLPMSYVGSSNSPQKQQADMAASQELATRQAALGSYGDWLVNRTLANMKTQRQLGQTVNFAQGTASLLPYAMYQAQHSQDMLGQMGAMISSIGGGSGQYGGPGMPQMQSQYFQPSNYGQLTPQAQQFGNYWANYYNNPASTGYVNPNTYQ